MTHIAKFNPYAMDSETIQNLATGRKQLLQHVIKTLKDNSKSSSGSTQLLIRGPRGMGKSFFLKYLQINFRKNENFENSDFALLPEEQNNIHSPSDFIRLVLNILGVASDNETIAQWDDDENDWVKQHKRIQEFILKKKSLYKNYLLVVVIENLNDFLHSIHSDKSTRDIYDSQFRLLLEKTKHLTIIGATPTIDLDNIDGNYNGRLFHAFKRCKLKRWNDEDYLNYFERRKLIKIAEQNVSYTTEQEKLMQAKLKAISKFTGGSPRMAVVLTDLLLEDNVLSTVNTLFGLIDDLTPYYQDLTKSIPPKSKILFDALIRKGENLSQSELADVVGATQSKIAKAFSWLRDNGYIIGKKREKSPAFSYHVGDRIHVLYYQQREIKHSKNITPIWLLADFLVAFYQENELKDYAQKYLSESFSNEAIDFAKIYLLKSGRFKADNLPEHESSEEWLNIINEPAQIYGAEPVEFDSVDEEITYYQSRLENTSKDFNILEYTIRLGAAYIKNNQYNETIVLLNPLESHSNINLSIFKHSFLAIAKNGLQQYKNSITSSKKAIKLMENNNHPNMMANVLLIAYNLSILQNYKESNNQLLEGIKKIPPIDQMQLKNAYKLLSKNHLNLKEYNESILHCEKALKIKIEKGNNDIIARLASNYIFLENWDAFHLFIRKYQNHKISFGATYGNTLRSILQEKGVSKAYEIGIKLITITFDEVEYDNAVRIIVAMLLNVLSDSNTSDLLNDLISETSNLCDTTERSEMVGMLDAIEIISQYIKSDKDPKFLENLSPDVAITIRNGVQSLGL